jgi:hypothetical protein
MVEAAGVEPASETPSSHEIRRLPGTPRQVSTCLSRSVSLEMFTTQVSRDGPSCADGF